MTFDQIFLLSLLGAFFRDHRLYHAQDRLSHRRHPDRNNPWSLARNLFSAGPEDVGRRFDGDLLIRSGKHHVGPAGYLAVRPLLAAAPTNQGGGAGAAINDRLLK